MGAAQLGEWVAVSAGIVPNEQARPDGSAALLDHARSGDARAFHLLVERHHAQVFRIALAILGRTHDAEDACQEVFVRVFRHMGRFDPRRELDPWLYRITVNVCREMTNKQRRARQVPIDHVATAELPTARDVSEVAAAREEWALMLKALECLPEKERAAIALRDIEGLSMKEVAWPWDPRK